MRTFPETRNTTAKTGSPVAYARATRFLNGFSVDQSGRRHAMRRSIACGAAGAGPLTVHTETVEAKVQMPVSYIDSVSQALAFLSDTDLFAPPNRDHIQREKWQGRL
jgi:hypothetical protein